MKFEVQVSQFGTIHWAGGDFVESCSTVVAIFKVDADNVVGALLKMAGTKEFQSIDRVDSLMISVMGEVPTYCLED